MEKHETHLLTKHIALLKTEPKNSTADESEADTGETDVDMSMFVSLLGKNRVPSECLNKSMLCLSIYFTKNLDKEQSFWEYVGMNKISVYINLKCRFNLRRFQDSPVHLGPKGSGTNQITVSKFVSYLPSVLCKVMFRYV